MSTTTSLIVNTSYGSGKKAAKAVPNVSASATDAELYNFGVALVALSTDTFEGVIKVTKQTLEAPTAGGE